MEDSQLSPAFLSLLFNEEIYVIGAEPPPAPVLKPRIEEAQSASKAKTIVSEPVQAELIPVSKTTLAEEIPEINFFGGFRKKTAILISDPDDLFINDSDKKFLTNILTAIQHNFNDIAVINLFRQQNLVLNSVINSMQPAILITFAISENWFSKKMTTGIHESEGVKVIFMPWSLADISLNLEYKKILWKNLKELFQI